MWGTILICPGFILSRFVPRGHGESRQVPSSSEASTIQTNKFFPYDVKLITVRPHDLTKHHHSPKVDINARLTSKMQLLILISENPVRTETFDSQQDTSNSVYRRLAKGFDGD